MTTIKNLSQYENQQATLQGWVTNLRTGKGLAFIYLRDGSGVVQCVANEAQLTPEKFDVAKRLTQETSIQITGNVVKDDKQVGGYEVQIIDFEVVGAAADFPITNKEHGIEFLMNNRHLWLRSRRQWAIMRIRNTITMAIHGFFQDRDFVQMDAPIFYGVPAYLSQSGQLYGEAMAMAMGKIYTFGPTFRAEKSKTRRHLSEFWMIEPEMAFCDLAQNLDVIEAFLQHVVGKVLEKNQLELDIIERDKEKLAHATRPFVRLTYTDAIAVLKGEKPVNGKTTIEVLTQDLQQTQERIIAINADIAQREQTIANPNEKQGVKNFNLDKIAKLKAELTDAEEQAQNIPNWLKSAQDFTFGDDLGGSDETVITRMYNEPIMVYNWPHEVKAFYMKRDETDPRFAKGVDVLAPEGYGEIVGGGERETNLEWLQEKITEHQLPMQAFEWYLDLRRYGSVPHAGFGLGLERLVAYVCKLKHVRETIPFPRMYGRLEP
jgi:asparaginyl-tRNA synthetase